MSMRVFILVVLLVTPALALAQPDALNDKATKAYLKGYDFFQRANEYVQNIHPVREENSLRGSVMRNWFVEDTEARSRWVEEQDWTAEYKAMFRRAVRWRKDAFNGGAEKLYRLSRKYLNAPNAENYGYVGLSGTLLYRAAMAGHAKAIAEFKVHPFQAGAPAFSMLLDNSRLYFYEPALENDQEAINTLIVSYLIGTIFDDDRQKGYYWLLRTRELALSDDTWAKLRKAVSCLTDSERQEAKVWLSSGYVPPM